MLSSVFLTGRLGDMVSERIRIVEVDAMLPDTDGRFKIHKIPVFYPKSATGLFFTAKGGTFVVIKGRLETHKEIGLIVISELDEIYPTGL